jgi:hypothetical protein
VADQTGLAGLAKLKYAGRHGGADLSVKYVGENYQLFGYPQQLTDYRDVLLSPWVRLAKDKFVANASIGVRTNHPSLADIREVGATTHSVLASLSVFARPTPMIEIPISFANFGHRNTDDNDTTRLQMIAMNVSVQPSIKKKIGDLTHKVTVGFVLDNFNDLNTITGAVNDFNGTHTSLAYSLSGKKFLAGARASLMGRTLGGTKTNTTSIGVNGKLKLMDDRFQPFSSIVVLTSSAPAGKWLFRAGATYEQSELLDFDVSVSNHHFTFGNQVGVPAKNELKAEVAARYKIK